MKRIEELFSNPVRVINIGLVDFFTTLDRIGVDARHVELSGKEQTDDTARSKK